jgi:glycosyltransferase involved in cell wall biosynthesis
MIVFHNIHFIQARRAAAIDHEKHLLIADSEEDLANAREARQLVESHYDWTSIASGLLEIYEEMVSRPGGFHRSNARG